MLALLKLDLFRIESPWAWLCRDFKCVKEHAHKVKGHADAFSLAGCKLICNADSMLWPRPRGVVDISRTFATFLPHNLHFRRGVNTPSGEAGHLLDQAVDLYIQQLGDMDPVSMESASTMQHRVEVLIDFTSSDCQLKLDTEESYQMVISTGSSNVNETSCN